jgi:predicted NAD-dependent protein-ADP-ribosyltransferase YbiA (DUF1768 family)
MALYEETKKLQEERDSKFSSVPQKSFVEGLQERAHLFKNFNPDATQGIDINPISMPEVPGSYERRLGKFYDPTLPHENFLAEQQTGAQRLLYMTPRIATATASQVLQLPGYLGGALAWAGTGFDKKDIGLLVDNVWNNAVSKIEDSVKDQMPVYATDALKSGSLMKNIFSTQFWANEGADGIGFLLAFLAPGAALRAAKFGTAAAKIVKPGTAYAKILDATTDAEKAAEVLSNVKLADNINDVASTVVNTLFESSAEAGQTFDTVFEKSGDRMKAANAAVDVMTKNFGILSISNYIDQKWLFGKARLIQNYSEDVAKKALKSSVLGRVVNPETGKILDAVTKRTTFNQIGRVGKTITEGFLKEGFWEEGSQWAAQKHAELGESDDEGFFAELKDLANTYIDGLADTEMQKSIFLGGVLGSGMSTVQTVRQGKQEDKFLGGFHSLVKDNFIERYRNVSDLAEVKNGEVQFNEDGTYKLDPTKVDEAISKGLDKYIQNKELVALAKAGNKEYFEKVKNERDLNYFFPFISVEGGLQAALKHIDDLAEQDVKMMQKEGVPVDLEETKKELRDKVINYQNIYNRVQNTHDLNFNVKHEAEDNDLYNQFSTLIKNRKIGTEANISFSAQRINELKSELASYKGIDTNSIPITSEELQYNDKMVKELTESLDKVRKSLDPTDIMNIESTIKNINGHVQNINRNKEVLKNTYNKKFLESNFKSYKEYIVNHAESTQTAASEDQKNKEAQLVAPTLQGIYKQALDFEQNAEGDYVKLHGQITFNVTDATGVKKEIVGHILGPNNQGNLSFQAIKENGEYLTTSNINTINNDGTVEYNGEVFPVENLIVSKTPAQIKKEQELLNQERTKAKEQPSDITPEGQFDKIDILRQKLTEYEPSEAHPYSIAAGVNNWFMSTSDQRQAISNDDTARWYLFVNNYANRTDPETSQHLYILKSFTSEQVEKLNPTDIIRKNLKFFDKDDIKVVVFDRSNKPVLVDKLGVITTNGTEILSNSLPLPNKIGPKGFYRFSLNKEIQNYLDLKGITIPTEAEREEARAYVDKKVDASMAEYATYRDKLKTEQQYFDINVINPGVKVLKSGDAPIAKDTEVLEGLGLKSINELSVDDIEAISREEGIAPYNSRVERNISGAVHGLINGFWYIKTQNRYELVKPKTLGETNSVETILDLYRYQAKHSDDRDLSHRIGTYLGNVVYSGVKDTNGKPSPFRLQFIYDRDTQGNVIGDPKALAYGDNLITIEDLIEGKDLDGLRAFLKNKYWNFSNNALKNPTFDEYKADLENDKVNTITWEPEDGGYLGFLFTTANDNPTKGTIYVAPKYEGLKQATDPQYLNQSIHMLPIGNQLQVTIERVTRKVTQAAEVVKEAVGKVAKAASKKLTFGDVISGATTQEMETPLESKEETPKKKMTFGDVMEEAVNGPRVEVPQSFEGNELAKPFTVQGQQRVEVPSQQKNEMEEIPFVNTINIWAGTNENAILSNLANRPFEDDEFSGTVGKFNTVEGAYQAAKLIYSDAYRGEEITPGNYNLNNEGWSIVEKLAKATGAEAKAIGRAIKGLNVKEWDKVSSEKMKDLVYFSFQQNPEALKVLLSTKGSVLTHNQDKGKWRTEFPRILMEVRDELTPKPQSELTKPIKTSLTVPEYWNTISKEEQQKYLDSFKDSENQLELAQKRAYKIYISSRAGAKDLDKLATVIDNYKLEDLNKAKTWLKERFPLVPVEIIDGLIDNRSWGRLTKHGTVLLSSIAEEGTGYHEAFHVFSQLVLSPETRQELYAEVKKLVGDTDPEEYLSEEFRTYMLSPSSYVFSKKQQSTKNFFQKLLDLILSFFNLKQSDYEKSPIEIAFSVLETGKFNVVPRELSRDLDRIVERNRVPGLSDKEVMLFVKDLNFMFFDTLFDPDEDYIEAALFDPNKSFVDVYNEVKQKYEHDAKNEGPDSWYQKIVTHFEGLVAEHQRFLKQYGINVRKFLETKVEDQTIVNEIVRDQNIDNLLEDELENLDEEDKESNNDYSYRDHLNVNLIEVIPNQVKFLIAGLPDVAFDSGLVENIADYNLKSTVRFSKVMNVLNDHLTNLGTDFQEYANKIRNLIPYRPELAQLLLRLQADKADDQVSRGLFLLRDQFVRAFSHNKNVPMLTNLQAQGRKSMFNAVDQRVNNNIRISWSNRARMYVDTPGFYVTRTKDSRGALVIDKVKLLKDIGRVKSTQKSGSRERLDQYLTIMDGIGIKLAPSIKDVHNYEVVDNYITKLVETLQASKEEVLLSDIFNASVVKNQKETLDLIQYARRLVITDTDLSFYNQDGNKEYSINLNSHTSDVVNLLSKIRADAKKQEITYIPDEIRHLLPFDGTEGNLFNSNSDWLNEYAKGNRIRLVDLKGIVDEMNINSNTQISKATFGDYKMITFNALLKGLSIQFRSADRRRELAFQKVDSKGDPIKINRNITIQAFKNRMLDYLRDELNTSFALILDPANWGGNLTHYSKNAKELRTFKFLYDRTLNAEDQTNLPVLEDFVVQSPTDNNLDTVTRAKQLTEKYINDFGEYISNSSERYIEQLHSLTLASLEEDYVIRSAGAGPVYVPGLDTEVYEAFNITPMGETETITRRDLDRLVLFANYTQFVGTQEQLRYMMGDMAMWADTTDFHKRVNGATSPKNHLADGVSMRQQMDRLFKRVDRKTRTESVDIVVFNDIISKNEELAKLFADYKKITGTDAQSEATLDEYRDIMIRNGSWSLAQERTYQYEQQNLILRLLDIKNDKNKLSLLKTLNNGKDIPFLDKVSETMFTDPKSIFYEHTKGKVPSKPMYRGKVIREQFIETYTDNKGNKQQRWATDLGTCPIQKPQGFGHINRKGLNVPQFFKTSTGAIMPSALDNEMLIHLLKMMAKGQGIMAFSSSMKGEVESLQDLNNESYESQQLAYRDFGIQLDISEEEKGEVTVSTQRTRLEFIDIFDSGRLVKNEALKNLRDDYVKLTNEIVSLERAQLLDELGLKLNVEKGVYELVEGPDSKAKFKNRLIKAFDFALMPYNVIDGLELALDSPEKVFDVTVSKFKIEEILTSMVRRNVISRKTKGDMLVQEASVLYDRDLKFYQKIVDKQGNERVLPMEIMISLPAELFPVVEKLGGLDKLNEAIEKHDTKLLGDEFFQTLYIPMNRIPGQSLSSLDLGRVKKFLPHHHGAKVVLPPEITVKAGSDFDVDKMTSYFSYITVNEDGKVHYISNDTLWGKKNKLNEIARRAILDPERFEELIHPLNARELRGLIEKASEKVARTFVEEEEFVTGGKQGNKWQNVPTWWYNMQKGREFWGSKAGVAITAVHNVSNALNQVHPIRMKAYVPLFFKGHMFTSSTQEIASPEKPIQKYDLKFEEEQRSGYKARTIKNASADATLALAINFTSGGEKLTYGAVYNQGKKYIPINIGKLDQYVSHEEFKAPDLLIKADNKGIEVTQERVDQIVNALNELPSSLFGITLNIAGNSIRTLGSTYNQEQLDNFVYNLLKRVIESPKLKSKIVAARTGGQTGMDEAGAKATARLGIPTTVLAPKGYTFRDIYGNDISSKAKFEERFGIVPTTTTALAKVEKAPAKVESVIDQNQYYGTGFLKDSDGYTTSRNFGQFLTAFVDVVKDPFIFDLTDDFTFNTIAFLNRYGNKGGVGLRTIIGFMTQDSIKEYLHLRRANSPKFLSANQYNNPKIPLPFTKMKLNAEEQYFRTFNSLKRRLGTADKVTDLPLNYSQTVAASLTRLLNTEPNSKDRDNILKEIRNKIARYGYREFSKEELESPEIRKDFRAQAQILDNFLMYQILGSNLGSLNSMLRPDARTSLSRHISACEANSEVPVREMLRRDLFVKEDIEAMIGNDADKTLISEFYRTQISVPEMFGWTSMMHKDPIIKEFFKNEVYPRFADPNKRMRKREVDRTVTTVESHLLTAIIQDSLNLESYKEMQQLYRDLFVGKYSVPKVFLMYKKALASNLGFRELEPSVAVRQEKTRALSETDNIVMPNVGLDTGELDAIESDFYDFATSANPDNQAFMVDMLMHSVFQSGFVNTVNSYLPVLPNRIFIDISERLISRFLELSDETKKAKLESFLRQFYRNSASNSKIVPRHRWTARGPNKAKYGFTTTWKDENNYYAKYDYIAMNYNTHDPEYFKKRGLKVPRDIVLYERKGGNLFQRVSKQGDGSRMLEYYLMLPATEIDNVSILDTNLYKTLEIDVAYKEPETDTPQIDLSAPQDDYTTYSDEAGEEYEESNGEDIEQPGFDSTLLMTSTEELLLPEGEKSSYHKSLGDDSTLQRALKLIETRSDNQSHKDLAKVFRETIRKPIPLNIGKKGTDSTTFVNLDGRLTKLGQYSTTDKIAIYDRLSDKLFEETLLHEATHALVHREYLNNEAFRDKMDRLVNHTRFYLSTSESNMAQRTLKFYKDVLTDKKWEFVSHALTDSTFQSILSRVPSINPIETKETLSKGNVFEDFLSSLYDLLTKYFNQIFGTKIPDYQEKLNSSVSVLQDLVALVQTDVVGVDEQLYADDLELTDISFDPEAFIDNSKELEKESSNEFDKLYPGYDFLSNSEQEAFEQAVVKGDLPVACGL